MGTYELAVAGLLGSGVGTALGLPMAWPRRRGRWEFQPLGLAMLLLSLIAATISARLAGLVPTTVAIAHVVNVLGLTALPLVVHHLRHDDVPSEGRGAVASLWLPVAVYAVWVLARGGLGLETAVPFRWLLPAVLWFTVLAMLAVWRSAGRSSAAPVPPAAILGLMVAVNVAQIVRMDLAHLPIARAAVPLAVTGGFLVLVAIMTWRAWAERAMPAAADPPRYARSALDDAAARALLARVHQALSRDRLFANPAVTLAQVAAAAGSSPHHVSEALNRVAGISLRELLNRRRVEDVKAQLEQPDSDRFTIEGIGASAGFGSRSALYAAFQRAEGMTPAAYRAALRRRSRSDP
jgi:AraC-like DNA-binding protein